MAVGGQVAPLFREINADEDEQEVSNVESLCLNCGKNGNTQLLLTKIPFYNEIIVISFECPHCGYRNNETQFGGRIQEKGVKIKALIQNEKDLSRQVVKSDFATVCIPEVDLEIPSQSRKGEVTTVEGIINSVIQGLEQDQARRKEENAEVAVKIEEFMQRLEKLKTVAEPFHLILNDPSGNSFIENPLAPHKDETLEVNNYVRDREEDILLGLLSDLKVTDEEEAASIEKEDNILESEIVSFQTNCFACNSPCETNMKPTKIPHFKEVIIMATNCEACGHRTNEVKSGAGIELKGKRWNLHLTNPRDLHRDVLKSETCKILIPELDLEVGGGALGGRFTTVEGLISSIEDQLKRDNPLLLGDSSIPDVKSKMDEFLHSLREIAGGNRNVHLILDDPAGNSYVQNFSYPENDPELLVEDYERTFDQNEELGLNDMKTENY